MTSTAFAHRLAVVGAGTMGTGIAALAVGHGIPTVLIDIDEAQLDRARSEVFRLTRLGQMMGGLPRGAQAGELVTTGLVGDLAEATAVVECVTERADLKAEVLAEVTKVVAPGTPVLSNTSGIPVDELAEAAARPADVLGAHFMNPPYIIRAVEVIRGRRTSPTALERGLDLLTSVTREPIVVGDAPGFVINRILQWSINRAAHLVEEGVSTPADVDALFVGCLGHRTGPLATADLIGLDNVVDSLWVLQERTGDAGYQPAQLLQRMVREGKLGRKSGQGFFEYGGTRS
ncbi:3-hydroxyacyl-CoA dehydrogenase family protein [Micromonospora sp. NPDC048871]|uniref:3-hydroxyacyl-CoA dehydrogenase family protein n=1 Tax=unclassified Micromonospora TaxID=2617518 RepID=UPI002E11E148|nr:3-hydroxyacyl-CoA dehydrogenase family protein [Micromonospora sp. NBC_01739]